MDPEEPRETILQWMLMMYSLFCLVASHVLCCIVASPLYWLKPIFCYFLNLRLFLGFLVSSACFNPIFVAVTLSKTFT